MCNYMKNIESIEKELQNLLNTDKSNWVKIYELMEEVDKNFLWEEKYKSYTAWVRGLAEKVKVHESLLWSRKKAGAVYAAYAKRSEREGKTVEEISKINISPDSLVYCEKIAQGNSKVEDELIEKALAGEMGRNDLRKAWKAARANVEANGIKAIRSNANESFIPVLNDLEYGLQYDLISAADITLALRTNEWLSEAFELYMNNSYEKRVYSILPEFPVHTGTTKHSRRIDVVILENQTTEKPFEIMLHGVEIKVSKHDLLNDQKTSEYKDFVDYLWLAVPEALKEEALNVAGESWGIITINKNKEASIFIAAKKSTPVFKTEALNTAVIKLI